MCGIVGYYRKDNATEKLNDLEKATSTLSKRGPDFSSTYYQGNIGFGHARLSIIDTSAGANQPFVDSTGRYVIIFNGEIYNFKILKRQLEKEGIKFITESDTEVLLELYIKYGENVTDHLNGFFAFAIHDKKDNTLFLSRDRLGIKPLFLYQDNDKIIFASEIKAITEFRIEKELHIPSLHRYFQLNYIPGPDTIFEHIKQIEPGTRLFIKNGEIESTKYYHIPNKPTYDGGYNQAQQKLKSLMLKSIERRLIADVPVGSFLSGGIDSSIIALLTSTINKSIESFSIGFPDEPYYDETEYAKAVAKKGGLKHHIINVHSKDMLEALPEVVDYIDQPFADSSALPVFILSREVRKHVTVALSGDGADELFGGYRKHMAHFKALNKSLVNALIKTAGPIFNLAPQSRQNALADKARQAARFSQGIKRKGIERYWHWASISTEAYTCDLLKEKWPDPIKRPWEELGIDIPKKHHLHHILQADVKMLLPNDMLTKVDLMSMANSLEVRVPFLDHEIVNFAMSLPDSFKINEHSQKRILQDTFKRELPKELFNRPKKGFEVPLLNWFRKDLFELIFNDLLSKETIEKQNIFNYSTIEKLKKQLISSNQGDSQARIWALIAFQQWYRKYIN
ncbi:MAG: asparagine synthase (glutamine-hydrolyzing) [Salinivirgaceae bacterium]|nr:MAG: asparagine synthase (glutamine-hydrolyzing) [Salinivirgaceae bacterium]